MNVDRLKDLTDLSIDQEIKVESPRPLNSPRPSISNDNIQKSINSIKRLTDEVHIRTDNQRVCTSQEQRKKISDDINFIADQVRKIGQTVKADLEEIKRRGEKNIYQLQVAKFQNVSTAFQEAVNIYNNLVKDRSRRELQTIYPEIEDCQIDKIIEKGLLDSVMESALVGEQLHSVISDIENRHSKITHFESTVREIYQLTVDLGTLIDLQQESLNVIEVRIGKSKDHTRNGTEELVVADNYSKTSRRRSLYACCCIVIILFLIIFPIVGSKTNVF
jgi:t-SNARE complex subunit (syntaxin)